MPRNLFSLPLQHSRMEFAKGRGMAALLLDNEAEAVTYQRAALSEILKDHAAA